MRPVSITLILVGLLVACGPSGRGDDTGGDGDGGGSGGNYAEVKGKVWAPNQGPGQAMAGQEIPIAGALVYVSASKPDPIPDQVYCEQCVPTPNGGALTGADGSFSLQVPPGRYWVVIQKGQFRLEAEYELQLGTLDLPAPQTTLPSVWDPATGRYMPRMAMATGTNDQIEDILGKLGVGTMAGNTFQSPAGEKGPELDIYEYEGTAAGSVTFLLSNIAAMRKYHIIFFPCSTSMEDIDALLRNQTILANIRRYVSEGGKLYVTDWSGELADRAFPQQVVLGDFGTDSDGTYDATTFTGTLTTPGTSDGDLYEVMDGKTLDADLGAWLGLQMGPTEGGTGIAMYNPQSFVVTDLWNWVQKLNTVQIGVDSMGMPVYDAPKAWVTGSKPGTAGAMNRPIAVTYQPAGCGKVLFTPFQTANGEHAGLYPQERVLLYLIMEITTCSDNPIL